MEVRGGCQIYAALGDQMAFQLFQRWSPNTSSHRNTGTPPFLFPDRTSEVPSCQNMAPLLDPGCYFGPPCKGSTKTRSIIWTIQIRAGEIRDTSSLHGPCRAQAHSFPNQASSGGTASSSRCCYFQLSNNRHSGHTCTGMWAKI